MQRCKYHVPRLGSLACDFSRFLIADLAHHYYVGVLAQDASKLGGKRLACLGVDFNLRDVGDLAFHRVFDCDHVFLVAIDFVQA